MQAVLVVSFGTSHLDTLEKNIGAIEKAIYNSNRNYDVRRAFTSEVIIKKLYKRDGISVDNLKIALNKLADEGYRKVICQPSYIINGLEYNDMIKQGEELKNRFEELSFGKPLLSSSEDYSAVVRVLRNEYENKIDEETALVLMGHGTAHFADSAYAALDYRLKNEGCPRFFVGTVEGYPEIKIVAAKVKESGAKKVVLAPLMIVAGDHAVNDLSGEGEDSWKNVFLKAGLNTEIILRGLGEYEGIREIFCEHVKNLQEKNH